MPVNIEREPKKKINQKLEVSHGRPSQRIIGGAREAQRAPLAVLESVPSNGWRWSIQSILFFVYIHMMI
jgi:hypothetical protein